MYDRKQSPDGWSELQQAPGVQVEFVQYQPAAELPHPVVALEGVYDGLELGRVDACQAQQEVVLPVSRLPATTCGTCSRPRSNPSVPTSRSRTSLTISSFPPSAAGRARRGSRAERRSPAAAGPGR